MRQYIKLVKYLINSVMAVHLLDLVRVFPVLFSPLFTYSGEIDPRDIADGLFVDDGTELTRQNEIVMEFLNKYILKCTNKGENYLS